MKTSPSFYYSISDFLRDAKPDNFFIRLNRENEIAHLKESFSREELVPKYCTVEEYHRIPASTDHMDYIKNQRDISRVMNELI